MPASTTLTPMTMAETDSGILLSVMVLMLSVLL